MINTYQTRVLPPPPVPLRLSQQDPAALAPGRGLGGTAAVLWVLVVVVVLHLLLSVGGFFYLYTDGKVSPPSANPNDEGKKSALSSERRSEEVSHTSHTAMASMTVKRPSHATDKTALGYLQWNVDHSTLRNVDLWSGSWLRVRQPGDYYIYARVSFSRGGARPGMPLLSAVRLKHDETRQPRDVMKAYCSLGNRNTGQCTASQGQVLQLQVGNQLSVWVENSTWVDYEREATTFGLFKL